jgi:putative peptidoglycan lipid II flippase
VLAFPFSAMFTGPSDVAPMAFVLIAFLLGLLPLSVHYVLRRVFYALENTRTPFFITVFQAVLFVIGALLVGLLPAQYIALGIALVTSIAATLQAGLAFYLIRRRLGALGGRLLVRRHLAFLGASLAAAVVGFIIVWALGSFSGGFGVANPFTAGTTVAIAGFAMVSVYFAILLLARNPEAAGFVQPFISRVRRRQ